MAKELEEKEESLSKTTEELKEKLKKVYELKEEEISGILKNIKNVPIGSGEAKLSATKFVLKFLEKISNLDSSNFCNDLSVYPIYRGEIF